MVVRSVAISSNFLSCRYELADSTPSATAVFAVAIAPCADSTPPATAVFAAGDGLDPYRRLLVACEERLHDGAAVVIQLHRRVLAATRDELPALRARLERDTLTMAAAA